MKILNEFILHNKVVLAIHKGIITFVIFNFLIFYLIGRSEYVDLEK